VETAPSDEELEGLRKSLYADLLTYDEAMFVLDVSRYTLSRMIARGQIAAIRIGTRAFVARSELTNYVEDLRRDAITRRDAAKESA
jgi:excisionase family DNA binding protein